MATVAEVPVETLDDRERLGGYSFAELKVVAEEIGAESGRSKKQLVENILAKKDGTVPEAFEEPEEEEAAAVGEPETVQDDEYRELVEVEEGDSDAPVLPIKHLMLTMFDKADPSTGVLDQVGVNERVDELLAKGYEPVEFATLGFSPGGHKLFYVFRLVDKPRYTRSMHIMRLLTPQPNPLRGTITGFQADAYISAFIDQGWTLIGARYNGDDVLGESTTGIFLIWMLVK